MEKINHLFLSGLLMALMLGFSGCSDGDERGIIGSWAYNQSGGEYTNEIKFNRDGTFRETEKEYYRSSREWITNVNEGTYVYDEIEEEIVLNYTYYNGSESSRVITIFVIEFTSKKLTVDHPDLGDITYKRK